MEKAALLSKQALACMYSKRTLEDDTRLYAEAETSTKIYSEVSASAQPQDSCKSAAFLQHGIDQDIAEIEARLLKEINALGIGPAGLKGKTTALGVRLLSYPTHIAGLPVAVNIGCHVSRHKSLCL